MVNGKRVKLDLKAFELKLAENSEKNPKSFNAYLNSKCVIKDTVKAIQTKHDPITTNKVDIADCLNYYFVSVFLNVDKSEEVEFHKKCTYVCMDPSFDEAEIQEQN